MISTLPVARVPIGPALALQGGGVHGAFAWGAADRLLEDGVRPSRISGVSSGALLGTMLAQGMAKGGIPGARQEMRLLWNRIAQAHTLAPLRGGAMDQWFWGGEAGSNLAWEGIETALRMFSPAQLNPFDHNPLRAIIADLIDRRALADASAIPLVVSATDVQTGAARHWTNASITVDVLLASCCVPFVFQPVQVDGRAFWDGAYSGNPPLAPLLDARPAPTELILIRAQTSRRRAVPRSQSEILNRVTEIACNGMLEAELTNLPDDISLTDITADAALELLPLSSKYTADDALLAQLFAAGRVAADISRTRAGTAAN
jgi:NTE family protein